MGIPQRESEAGTQPGRRRTGRALGILGSVACIVFLGDATFIAGEASVLVMAASTVMMGVAAFGALAFALLRRVRLAGLALSLLAGTLAGIYLAGLLIRFQSIDARERAAQVREAALSYSEDTGQALTRIGDLIPEYLPTRPHPGVGLLGGGEFLLRRPSVDEGPEIGFHAGGGVVEWLGRDAEWYEED